MYEPCILRHIFLATLLVSIEEVMASNETSVVCQRPTQASQSLAFTPQTLTSDSQFLPRRLKSPGWSQVPTVLECAHQTLQEYPQARGYLFSAVTRLCTPVLWLESSARPGARELEADEGTLYLAAGVCGNGFTLYEYGTEGELACLQDSDTLAKYKVAASTCASWGGYLASVKTAAKLDLLTKISCGQSRWIGLDDIDVEGQHIWLSDGSTLTSAEKEAVFASGEPNDLNGNEDCVQIRASSQQLNDKPCYYALKFVCEMTLPSLDC